MANMRAGGGGGGGSSSDSTEEDKKQEGSPEPPEDNKEMFKRAGEAAEAGAPIQDADIEPVGAGQTEEMATASTENVNEPDRKGDDRLEAPSGSSGGGGSSGNSGSGSNSSNNDGSSGGQSQPDRPDRRDDDRLEAPSGTQPSGGSSGGDQTTGDGSNADSGGGNGGDESTDTTRPDRRGDDRLEAPSGTESPSGGSSNGNQSDDGPGFDPRPDSYDDAEDVGSTEEERTPGGDEPLVETDDGAPEPDNPVVERRLNRAQSRIEKNTDLDRDDYQLVVTDSGWVEWGGLTTSGEMQQVSEQVQEEHPGAEGANVYVNDQGEVVGEPIWGEQPDAKETPGDSDLVMTSGGGGPTMGTDEWKRNYVEAALERDLGKDVTVHEVNDDGTVEYTVNGADRYGNNPERNAAEAARRQVEKFGSEDRSTVPDEESEGDIFSGAVEAFEETTGVDLPGEGSVIDAAQNEISPTASVVDANEEQRQVRRTRETKYAAEAEQFVEDITSGQAPSAGETGSFIFQVGEGVQRIGMAAGQGIENTLPLDGRGPVVGGGGNTVGTQAERAIAGLVEDMAVLAGGAVQGANTIPRGVQQIATGERSASSAARDVGGYGKQTASSQAQYFADNPAELAIDFAGGVAAAKAYGNVGSTARAGTDAVRSGVSRARESGVGSTVRAAGSEATSTAVEAARRRPRVRVTRDSDAGLLEIDEGLKQSIAEQASPSDLPGRARDAVSSRTPSRPSRPDVDLSAPDQQQVNDMAYRAGARSKQTQQDVRSAVEYEVSRMRDRVENAGSGSEWSLPDQQQVNDAAYRAGYRFEARKNELARDIEATKSELAGRLAASGSGRPSFPDQQQINDAAYRAGYRTEAKKQAVRSAVEYEITRMRDAVENAGSGSEWSLPDQQQVNDAAYRAGYRFEASKNELASDIALAKNEFAARLGAGGPGGGFFPNQQQVNDMAYRTGYRFEARKNELASDARFSLGQLGGGGASTLNGQQLVSDALSAGSARVDAARRLPSELTVRVEPGRPPRQDRVIDANDLEISLEGSLPSDDLDTAPWLDEDSSQAVDAGDVDVDGPSTDTDAGAVEVDTGSDGGTTTVMRQRRGDSGKSAETGPNAMDAVDSVDSSGPGLSGLFGAPLAALGPIGSSPSGSPATQPSTADVTGTGAGQVDTVLDDAGTGLGVGSGVGAGTSWAFDSGSRTGRGQSWEPTLGRDLGTGLDQSLGTQLRLGTDMGLGSAPPGRPPGARGGGDDNSFGPGSGDDDWGLGGSLSASQRPLAAGWVAETFTTMATMGMGPSQTLSQSELEKRADDGWELPTYAMVHGSAETRDRISEVQDLFGGLDAPTFDDDSSANGGGWF